MFSGYQVEYNGYVFRRLAIWFLVLLVISGVLLLGYFSSPLDDHGRPLLLTPRLAQIVVYQHNVHRWTDQLKNIHASLTKVLSRSDAGLFEQDQEVNRLYGDLLRLREEVDGTKVPLTMESLQLMMQSALDESSTAVQATATWVGEPTAANHLQAEAALETASESLNHLLDQSVDQAMNLRDIRLQELSASVDSYRAILSLKQKEVDAARKQIFRIGQELCGEAMQVVLKADGETISLEALASYVIFHAGTIQKNVNSHPDSRQHNSGMAQELDELRRQLDFQTHRAQQAETELANLKNTVESLDRMSKAQDTNT